MQRRYPHRRHHAGRDVSPFAAGGGRADGSLARSVRPTVFCRLAAAVFVASVAIAGCGRHVAGLHVLPDTDLVDKLRAGAAPAANEAAAEAAAAPTGEQEWGDLTGKFVFDGPAPTPAKLDVSKEPICAKHNAVNEGIMVGPDGGLRNVVIFLASKKVPVHPDYEATAKDEVELDNKDCRFEPHVVTLRTTQTLVLKNSDPVSHNSNVSAIGEAAFNPVIAPDGAARHQFSKSQNLPATVTCNIHSWMKGYVLPRDNPYAAVTGDDGSFTIKNLPAGTWEFQVWQESAGGLAARPDWKKGKFKLEIKPGANDLGTIQVAANLLEK